MIIITATFQVNDLEELHEAIRYLRDGEPTTVTIEGTVVTNFDAPEVP
jgi:hypothetical protein